MLEVGRVCLKIAGRDAGRIAVIVEKIKENLVLVDGNVRRRNCSIKHLEPTETVLKIKKGATTEEVHKAMSTAKLKVAEFKKVKRSPKKEKTETKKSKKETKKK